MLGWLVFRPQSGLTAPQRHYAIDEHHVLIAFLHSDAFALNIGYDSWQPGQVKAAYDAASATGTGFKMFISLDMTVLSCSDNAVITKNIADYKDHPAQLKDSKGAVLLSTFDGGNCKSSQDWANAFSAAGTAVRFFPAFFNDLTSTTLKSIYPVIGGDLIVSSVSASHAPRLCSFVSLCAVGCWMAQGEYAY